MSKLHIATTTLAIVSVMIVVLQFSQNSQLKTEVEQLNAVIVRYESAADRGVLSALERARADDKAGRGDEGLGDEAGSVLEPEGVGGGLPAARDLAGILAMRDPLERLSALMAYVGTLETGELSGALEALRSSTPEWDPDARVVAGMMLKRWAKADPDGALAYLAGLDFRKAGGDAAAIVSTIASTDPARAVKWLEDPENKMKSLPWMGQILAGSISKEWVRQDPEAALAWAMSVPDDQRQGAYSGVLGTIAATDPARASQLAVQLPDGDAKRDIIGQIARSWSERSPAEALEWAGALEGGEDRRRGMGEALGVWAQSDPGGAAEYIAGLADDERTPDMVKRVASSWAGRAPAEAAEWIGGLPEGDAKRGAMGDVMWSWTVADPEAASSWLLEQPVSDSRDEGIGALARATFDQDPEAAVTWAASMSDGNRRRDSIAIGMRVWRERDPAAAEAWLRNNEVLSSEEVDSFLNSGSDGAE